MKATELSLTRSTIAVEVRLVLEDGDGDADDDGCDVGRSFRCGWHSCMSMMVVDSEA